MVIWWDIGVSAVDQTNGLSSVAPFLCQCQGKLWLLCNTHKKKLTSIHVSRKVMSLPLTINWDQRHLCPHQWTDHWAAAAVTVNSFCEVSCQIFISTKLRVSSLNHFNVSILSHSVGFFNQRGSNKLLNCPELFRSLRIIILLVK